MAAGSEPLRPAVATTDDGDDDDDLRSVDACDMLYENTVTIMPSMQTPGTTKLLPSYSGVAPSACASSGPLATRLLDQVRERIRYLHYSIRTEEAYVHWVKAFVRFQGLRHPKGMGGEEVQAFLTWLSVERRVSASTHRQALSALLFLFQQVFGQ